MIAPIPLTRRRETNRTITTRVEMLGKLNDRRVQALTAGNRNALMELAAEYSELNCPRMVNEIVAEAEGI